MIWLADQQKRYADDMDVNELAALRDRLGLDDVTVCQADDPAGYARRWRIRTGRVTSVLLSVREARELLDLAEKVVRPISPAPMDVFTKGEQAAFAAAWDARVDAARRGETPPPMPDREELRRLGAMREQQWALKAVAAKETQ